MSPFVAATAAFASALTVEAQRPGAFGGSIKDPAIAYQTAPVQTAVTALAERLEKGEAALTFDPENGYLRSVLDALDVPVESQVLSFGETSEQAKKINQQNPRAIYFNDTVAVGWVRGGDVLEVSAQDPRQGTIYYTLPQSPAERPAFTRNDQCLRCHLSWDTLAVPGPMVLTVLPRQSDRDYADGGVVDHRTPISDRWGGWFVTGARVPPGHQGNVPLIQATRRTGPPPALASITKEFDTAGYLSHSSDVAALMVLEHQAHATNLITRLNWEARAGTPDRVDEAVGELVDYLLFMDEVPIAGRIEGSPAFAKAFAARGPKDGRGRSLRDLRLEGRLMQYPLSYMIYTPMFDALPDEARRRVYDRLWQVLSGADTRPKYAHLSAADRRAVVEILRDTKKGLPASFE
jgi:hypothetical protein